MKFLVVFAAFVLAVSAVTDKEQWLQFKAKHGKEYRNLREEQKRFAIFQDSLRTIEAHNELYEKGEKTWYMGVNQFADMTPQEFKSMLNNSLNTKPALQGPTVLYKESGVAAPASVNWVSQGVVTEVKNQGQCGSCWAFGSIGAVEGAYALKHGNLVSFSEQNLLDCSTVNGGCDGGWQTAAFEYIRDNGVETENDYPYTAVQGGCRFDRSLSVTRVSNYVILPQTEDALLDAVANIGPISVSVNADLYQYYSGGVMNDPACDASVLNHAVLAVGYGNENGVDYWLVKNSWSQDWGESGYIKHIRNYNNQCGIGSDGTYPLVD